jgi:hypothetical protein
MRAAVRRALSNKEGRLAQLQIETMAFLSSQSGVQTTQ